MRTPGEQTAVHRRNVLLGAGLIQICLGAIYAWPVFIPKLCDPAGPYAFTAAEAQWIFSSGMIAFVLAAVASGQVMLRFGPVKTAAAGGILLGAGYILGGMFGKAYVAQLITIGIIGGLGTGLVYMVPITAVVKWFPDKKGLVIGLAVAGFGFGSLIWDRLAGSGLNLINTLSLFGLDGLRSVFMLFGFIFLIAIVPVSRAMGDPPLGWSPSEWVVSASEEGSGAVNFDPFEMIRLPQFICIWVAFLLSATAGLIVIDNIETFGISALKASGLEMGLAVEAAGWAVASLVIMNGLGRIIWGSISDIIGRKESIMVLCFIQSAVIMISYQMGHDPKWLILGACIIGFNFGGNFALFPAITADYFGNRNVGLNYGYVLLSYGIAGLIGPRIAGYFRSAAQSDTRLSVWLLPFVIAGAACLIGAALVFFCRPPKKS